MGLLGYDPQEPSERTKRIWLRGKMLGAYMADRFAIEYGEENIIREKAVPWPSEGLPLGELHTDVFLIPEGMPVEVKSSAFAGSLLEDALTQLWGEIHFDRDAGDFGTLAIVNPIDLEEEILPVQLTSSAVERVEEIAAQVAEAAKTQTLPPCSACSPTECHFKGCPYTATAWEDWTPPDPENLDGEIKLLVTELYNAGRARKLRKAELEELEGAEKEIRQELLVRGLAPGVEYQAGPLTLKFSEVAASERFSRSKALAAGIWTPEDDARFGPFIARNGGHKRWYVNRTGEGPLLTAEDYSDEEVPF